MMILKTARRGALLTVVGAAALALSACGAGQISQTSDQVAAVDGAGAETANKEIAVRDVTVIVNEDKTAALKFTAVNQDSKLKNHTLTGVKVDGKEVTLSAKPTIKPKTSLVADDAKNIAHLKQGNAAGIEYVETKLENNGLAAGGTKPVTFTFDSGEIKVDATVSTNHSQDRKEGFADTRVTPSAAHSH